MALQKTMTLSKFGTQLTFADAYISIREVVVVQDKRRVALSEERDAPEVLDFFWRGYAVLNCHVSREAKYAGEEGFEVIRVDFTLNPGNQNAVHAFIYGLLKQDPRFADAIDV